MCGLDVRCTMVFTTRKFVFNFDFKDLYSYSYSRFVDMLEFEGADLVREKLSNDRFLSVEGGVNLIVCFYL